MQATSTTTVPWMTWFCVGHSTLWSSAHDSAMNRAGRPKGPPLAGRAWTSPAGRAPRGDAPPPDLASRATV